MDRKVNRKPKTRTSYEERLRLGKGFLFHWLTYVLFALIVCTVGFS